MLLRSKAAHDFVQEQDAAEAEAMKIAANVEQIISHIHVTSCDTKIILQAVLPTSNNLPENKWPNK